MIPQPFQDGPRRRVEQRGELLQRLERLRDFPLGAFQLVALGVAAGSSLLLLAGGGVGLSARTAIDPPDPPPDAPAGIPVSPPAPRNHHVYYTSPLAPGS
jgi:hypothetical protein